MVKSRAINRIALLLFLNKINYRQNYALYATHIRKRSICIVDFYLPQKKIAIIVRDYFPPKFKDDRIPHVKKIQLTFNKVLTFDDCKIIKIIDEI